MDQEIPVNGDSLGGFHNVILHAARSFIPDSRHFSFENFTFAFLLFPF